MSDFASVLQPQERAYLEQLSVELERNTTAELAIVTVPSLEGETIEQFAIELAEKWKVGKRDKDNGIILLLAPKEREVRIEVGYGLEGALPDSRASRIIRERMVPFLREDRWFEGLRAGAEAVAGVVRAEAPEGTNQPGPPDSEDLWAFTGLWLLICSFLFGILYFVSGKVDPPVKRRKTLGATYAGSVLLTLFLMFVGSWLAILTAMIAFFHIFALAFSLPGQPGRGGGTWSGAWGSHGSHWGGGWSGGGGGGFGGGFGGGGFGGGGASGRF